ncbi:MAG: zinc ribbon domain-containing protein [Bacilli bacterium]|nr:zinc ribbon domain-containing protein [Bacilli bacterium]
MTHYCHHCGKEVENGNKFCPYCGALQDRYSDDYRYEERKDEYEESKTSSSKVAREAQTGLDLAVKIFMVLSTVAFGFALIPLIWMVPMTIHAFHKADNNEEYGIGFSICSLIFVDVVAGILMIIRDTYKTDK